MGIMGTSGSGKTSLHSINVQRFNRFLLHCSSPFMSL
ncbi:hypothetical protein ACIQAA_18690 [Neobacillus sp. NPDC093182]